MKIPTNMHEKIANDVHNGYKWIVSVKDDRVITYPEYAETRIAEILGDG